MEYRDLTGPEKVKLLKNIKISTLLPNSPDNEIIQQIWDNFSGIAEDLKQDFKLDEVNSFKIKVKDWLAKFLFYTKQRMSHLICVPSAHMSPNFFLCMATLNILLNRAWKSTMISHQRTSLDILTIEVFLPSSNLI